MTKKGIILAGEPAPRELEEFAPEFEFSLPSP